jgi:hypothetical protein
MVHDKISHNAKGQREIRRELRHHGTAAEGALWLLLKGRQLAGLRWRRQFSVGMYILDFYCPAAHLGVELDGADHFTPDGEYNDERRMEYLWVEHGIRVLHFENKLIFEQPENVLETIRLALSGETPPSA